MLKTALVALLFVAALPALAQVRIEAQDVGEIYQTNTGHATILFINDGAKPVQIVTVVPIDNADGIGDFKFPVAVAPRTSVNIPVRVSSGMDAGDRNHLFKIEFDDGKRETAGAKVHLYGLSVLDDPQPKVDLATVDTNAVAPTKTVSLASREVPDFRITRIVETPDFVTAKLMPDGRSIAIAGKTDAGWGRHDGYVKVALDSTVQPQAWIEVKADVHGAVIPSSNPVEMGIFHTTKLPFVVQLKSRDGKPVKLGEVKLEGFKGAVTKQVCVGNTAGCAQLSVTVADDQGIGVLRGKLLVDLPDFHRQLPVNIGGLYVPASAKVHSLDETMPKGAKSSAEPPPLDLKSALQKSTQVALPAPPDPPGKGPLLKWQVSNETNIYGYLIYRGDSENGAFLRVNKDIVHVGADKGDGITSTYAWRDDSAVSGKTYWYYIGMLNRDGSKQNLSGPQEVKAK
ncbi:MAG: hypothetical protein JSR27_05510 [Proteobacteria bacterium]|nr:hypothetical protein [Pseudomonadota bacterium]